MYGSAIQGRGQIGEQNPGVVTRGGISIHESGQDFWGSEYRWGAPRPEPVLNPMEVGVGGGEGVWEGREEPEKGWPLGREERHSQLSVVHGSQKMGPARCPLCLETV